MTDHDRELGEIRATLVEVVRRLGVVEEDQREQVRAVRELSVEVARMASRLTQLLPVHAVPNTAAPAPAAITAGTGLAAALGGLAGAAVTKAAALLGLN